MDNDTQWKDEYKDGIGKYIQFIDNCIITEDKGDRQSSIEELTEKLELDEFQASEIEEYAETQIRLGLIEFINRFTRLMAQNLDGYCMLRSLGYHVTIEHEGRECTSLRQIAQHFSCSHQHIHQLTEDFAKRLGITDFQSTAIQKRKKRELILPEGYISLGKAIRKYKTSRARLLRHIKDNNIPVKDWKNKSVIFEEALIKEVKPRRPRQVGAS